MPCALGCLGFDRRGEERAPLRVVPVGGPRPQRAHRAPPLGIVGGHRLAQVGIELLATRHGPMIAPVPDDLQVRPVPRLVPRALPDAIVVCLALAQR